MKQECDTLGGKLSGLIKSKLKGYVMSKDIGIILFYTYIEACGEKYNKYIKTNKRQREQTKHCPTLVQRQVL